MIWRRIALRLLSGLAVLFAVSVIIFLAVNVLPGDAARIIAGRTATEASLAQIRADLGLDRPLLVQFFGWLAGFVQFDLGMSLVTRQPVAEVVGPRILNTLALLIVTGTIAIPASFVAGLIMARRPGGWLDRWSNTAMIVLAGVPEFVIGIVLVLIFATGLMQILPPTSMLPPGQGVWQQPQVLVLPVLTLVITIIPYLGRLIRATLVEALSSEYVVTARLKGVDEQTILIRHALRNSLVPIIQASALTLAFILGGTVVIEFIFQYPGLGMALQQAVSNRDVLVIQAIVLIFSGGYVLFNLAADILTILVTPRLRS